MEKKAKELYTKMVGAHPRPQFLVDERMYRINSVLEATRCFQRQFLNHEDVADNITVNDKYVRVVYVWTRTSAREDVKGQHELKLRTLEAHSLMTPILSALIIRRKLLEITF